MFELNTQANTEKAAQTKSPLASNDFLEVFVAASVCAQAEDSLLGLPVVETLDMFFQLVSLFRRKDRGKCMKLQASKSCRREVCNN